MLLEEELAVAVPTVEVQPLAREIAQPTRRARRSRRARQRQLFVLVAATFLVQLAVLGLRSRHQWQHYNLSLDFAIFHQAWSQIGTRNLNPRLTVFDYHYWQSHFELITWPLAYLGHFRRDDGLSLLYLQDLATVASEAVVVAWVWSETRTRRGRVARFAVPLTVVLLVVNPWLYRAAGQDFHFEALATFFTLLAAWELWYGRRRGWVWVVLALLCGDVAGTYVAGLGLSFVVAGRRTRREGAVLISAGFVWVALAALLHANRGSGIDEYSYLASAQPVSAGFGGMVAVGHGMLRHPSRPVQAITKRLGKVWQNLAPTGVVGLVAPWTFGVMLAVLLANVLNGRPQFIEPSYQDLPVYLFGVLGTVLLVHALCERGGVLGVVALIVVAAVTVNALAFDATHYGRLDRVKVSMPAAGQLAAVRRLVPDDAEVIATFGVAGRFAGRRSLRVISYGGQRIPVDAQTVVFVFAPSAGNQPLPLAILEPAERYVRDWLGARLVYHGGEVNAYEWHASGSTHVDLP
jgi:hypothetical protein